LNYFFSDTLANYGVNPLTLFGDASKLHIS